MSRDPKQPVTIEDLIRLKRAERPAAEYWARFEAEMRAKQLAAIVGRRTWWNGYSRLFGLLAQLRTPLAALAAIAVAFLGVRFAVVGTAQSEPSHAAHAELAASAESDVPMTTLDPVVVEARVQNQPAVAEAKESQSAAATTSAGSISGNSADKAEVPSRTPFSEIVAVTLAHFRESQPDMAPRSVFGSDQELEATMASLREGPPAEPMARLDPASEERRSRLLATALPTYATTSPHSAASERLKERVSNDRMYESMDPYESNTRMSLEIKF